MKESFFDECKEQSRIKAEIVSKYFLAWARVIKSSAKLKGNRIGYIDFFAGPGEYEDGTWSTPLLVIEKVLGDRDLPDMFVSIFNDENRDHAKQLEETLNKIPGVDRLKYRPVVHCSAIEESTAELFNQMKTIPCLFFIDPFGYKGLSRSLIRAVIKDWACEAIFFFNYNCINRWIMNEKVRQHLDALFGCERLKKLREKLPSLSSGEREAEVLEQLCEAMLEIKHAKYVLPFRFLDDRGTRTSHHLIFLTKHFRGYSIMKDVMGLASSEHAQGIPNFSYVPASPQQDFLFGFNRPLDDLKEDLLKKFAGRTIKASVLYEAHSVGTPYLQKNYKAVLRELLDNGVISAVKVDGKKLSKRGFSVDAIVTFPEGEA